jgi:hypothetical protein
LLKRHSKSVARLHPEHFPNDIIWKLRGARARNVEIRSGVQQMRFDAQPDRDAHIHVQRDCIGNSLGEHVIGTPAGQCAPSGAGTVNGKTSDALVGAGAMSV